MKIRDHQKILRERLNALRGYMTGEIVDRDRILDNYANVLDRQDAEIRVLTTMLLECAVDMKTIDERVGKELATLKDDDEAQS